MKLDEKAIHWIALNSILSENPSLHPRLRFHLTDIDGLFSASKQALISLGLPESTAEAIGSPRTLEHTKKEIDWLGKKGYTPISIVDQEYPDLLREIHNPPLVLYCAGKIETISAPAISIVGSRKPTAYGRAVTEKLAKNLASRGLVVVSGMARGIDTTAHWGALKGGRTVAVLGSGLNNLYPPENRRLFFRIIEKGAVVTEHTSESPPLAHHFPQRNRIISALALGLVVTEAAKKSGSLISAHLALEQNREVMAVPGNITSPLSRGTNRLIQAGAKPIECWKDVVEALPLPYHNRFLANDCNCTHRELHLSPQETSIYGMLKTDSLMHIDEIVQTSGFSIQETLATLLGLELKDLIDQRPGKFFQRKL